MHEQPRSGAVGISALGMVSSLALDAVTSCAAARAGITRARELEYYPVRSLADGAEAGIVAHAIRELTLGFEGAPRLMRLMQGALADLCGQLPATFWTEHRVGAYLSLPSPLRRFEGAAWLPDDAARGELVAARAEAESELDPMLPAKLFDKGARLAGLSSPPPVMSVTTSGHTGVAQCLDRAWRDLEANRLDVALVGGIDSLVEETTLEWLDTTQRLKSINTPVGVQPGEGAAFLLLEPERSARARRAPSLARLDAVHFAEEPRSWEKAESPIGVGLYEAVRRAGRDPRDSVAWLVTDHTGEVYRATDWGMALVRLRGQDPAFEAPLVWYPAASFGDTGAAAGAFAACVALRAFARRYAPARSALVTNGSDGALRSAFRLTREEQR